MAQPQAAGAQTPSAERSPGGTTTPFTPRAHAFRFPNRFVDVFWSGRVPPVVGLPVTLTGRGRCGGMVFSALDHLYAGQGVPPWTPEAAGSPRSRVLVPPDGHPLADHIRRRQRQSMLTGWRGALDGLRHVIWSLLPDSALIRRTDREVPRILDSLEAGIPVALGLVSSSSVRPSDLGRNHQAICHGYRWSGSGELELLLYDPNHPFDPSAPEASDVVLTRAETRGADDDAGTTPSWAFQSVPPGARPRGWRGFFPTRYRPRPLPSALG